MLTVSWDTARRFLHVLAATVWVGGQLTVAALVPTLRRIGVEASKAAALSGDSHPAYSAVGTWRKNASVIGRSARRPIAPGKGQRLFERS
jgi:hypothetical protein